VFFLPRPSLRQRSFLLALHHDFFSFFLVWLFIRAPNFFYVYVSFRRFRPADLFSLRLSLRLPYH
jgi:hypothetical protein